MDENYKPKHSQKVVNFYHWVGERSVRLNRGHGDLLDKWIGSYFRGTVLCNRYIPTRLWSSYPKFKKQCLSPQQKRITWTFAWFLSRAMHCMEVMVDPCWHWHACSFDIHATKSGLIDSAFLFIVPIVWKVVSIWGHKARSHGIKPDTNIPVTSLPPFLLPCS